MESERKVINPVLVFLIAYLVNEAVSWLLSRCVSALGQYELIGYSIASRTDILFVLIPCAIIVLSVRKAPVKIMHFGAMGAEILVIAVSFLFATSFARAAGANYEIMVYTEKFIRFTAIWMLVGCVFAIAAGMLIRNKGWKAYLIVIVAAGALTVLLTYILMGGYAGSPRYGASGYAGGFFQPFCVFPFLAAVSNARIDAYVTATAAGSAPTGGKKVFSYLDQYKQKKK